jgi:pimeloyl-ACP methyl ester carboxylesterase
VVRSRVFIPSTRIRLVYSRFSAVHRGGFGPPLVCLHGFGDTWRTWELVLPMLERHHDVLAPTLAGHAGGPPIPGEASDVVMTDLVEHAMDEAGFPTAHIVGNSLGGYIALQLAARSRAETVVALSPAGGWAEGDESFKELLAYQRAMQEQMKAATPHADAIVATADGRRRATKLISENFEHIPAELLAHQMRGLASCDGAVPLVQYAIREGWSLPAERITCPVRILWGTEDKLLPWPASAARFREEWLPQADWVVLDGVGHCPQLDIPLETAELIVGFTARSPRSSRR